ncbi:MAG: hypothetical protein KatS3mg010_1133 [Acidimicrobiia bacterium]|nr:MAG: hypothetical protein KatS3mg010_1133 [Acidimicrobiia bacterium]
MRELAPRFPALHVLLVGDGELRAETERLACSAGLSGRVHLPREPGVTCRRSSPRATRSCCPRCGRACRSRSSRRWASGAPDRRHRGERHQSGDGRRRDRPGSSLRAMRPRWPMPSATSSRTPQRARRMAATGRHRVNRWFGARRQAEQPRFALRGRGTRARGPQVAPRYRWRLDDRRRERTRVRDGRQPIRQDARAMDPIVPFEHPADAPAPTSGPGSSTGSATSPTRRTSNAASTRLLERKQVVALDPGSLADPPLVHERSADLRPSVPNRPRAGCSS